MRTTFRFDGGDIAILSGIAFCIACCAAWATHVIWIIGKLASDQGATVGQMVLGSIGAFMPPVGVIHGFMIWCGAGF